MPRYAPSHKQQTRDRVLSVAAIQMRERGPAGVAVAGVMADAGLTHGGFYAHFASRDVFVDAVLERMFEESPADVLRPTEPTDPRDVLRTFVDIYLSRAHRDTRTAGCPLPFLTGDAKRLPAGARERLASGIAGMRALVAQQLVRLGHENADALASSCIAEAVGAVTLARAVTDRAESDQLLIHCRESLYTRLGLTVKSRETDESC